MNKQPWTGVTVRQAPHEPKVKRRTSAKAEADVAEAEYMAWRNGRWLQELWGRP